MSAPDMQKRIEIMAGWLHHADQDIRLVQALAGKEAELPEPLAVHIQQAAEKCFKALHVFFGHAILRTHDLASLAERLRADMPENGDLLARCSDFSEWWVDGRYPDNDGGVTFYATADEVREALASVLELRGLINLLIARAQPI